MLWDVSIQCDHRIEARRPDIFVLEKREKECTLKDIGVPRDKRIHEKQREKIEKYQDFNREIARLWRVRKVDVVPVIVGALGCVTKNIEKW